MLLGHNIRMCCLCHTAHGFPYSPVETDNLRCIHKRFIPQQSSMILCLSCIRQGGKRAGQGILSQCIQTDQAGTDIPVTDQIQGIPGPES